MARIDFLGTGISFPMEVVNGKLKSSSDEQLVEESIQIILNTRKGERLMRPEFGSDIQSIVFGNNNASSATRLSHYIREALEDYEPRIKVDSVKAYADSKQQNLMNVSIEYTIRTSNSRRNLVFPFYLEGSK